MRVGLLGAVLILTAGCGDFDGYHLASSAEAGSVDPVANDGGALPNGDGGCPGSPPTLYPDVRFAKPPHAGACTAADKTTTRAWTLSTRAWTDLYTKLTASCRQCVFSAPEDSTWGAVVYAPTGSLDNSIAHCIDVGGGSPACSAAFQRTAFCEDTVCGPCMNIDECLDQVATKECASQHVATKVSCDEPADQAAMSACAKDETLLYLAGCQ